MLAPQGASPGEATAHCACAAVFARQQSLTCSSLRSLVCQQASGERLHLDKRLHRRRGGGLHMVTRGGAEGRGCNDNTMPVVLSSSGAFFADARVESAAAEGSQRGCWGDHTIEVSDRSCIGCTHRSSIVWESSTRVRGHQRAAHSSQSFHVTSI